MSGRRALSALAQLQPHLASKWTYSYTRTLSKTPPALKSFTQNQPFKCWQCGIQRDKIGELFCERCKAVQGPRHNDNYFKVFGLDESFGVDLGVLRSKYRDMQSLLHPDKFSNKSPEEKRISEQFSSLVNEAYNTLQTPLSRAVHLLALHGQAIDEDDKLEDPQFLMEIMELNEEVEEANTEAKLIKLESKNKDKLEEIGRSLEDNFAKLELGEAKRNIVRMKYYSSVKNHIGHLIRERGITK